MAGKTQAELARAVKVSETSVSNWVNGTVVPRPKMVDAICSCLRCKREDLMVDHAKTVLLAPEDVLADEMKNRPELYGLFNFILQMKSNDIELVTDICKRLLK
jgi:DNA-binding XRE family transcriptional regulator